MRHFALIAVMLLGPLPASAQFTTVVTPPRRDRPAPAAAADARPQPDTATRAALLEMRAWVDSAAEALEVDAATAEPATPADTLAVAPERHPAAPIPAPRAAEPTVAFREGAPAPDTATSLPLLALIAVGALGAGLLLLWRPGA